MGFLARDFQCYIREYMDRLSLTECRYPVLFMLDLMTSTQVTADFQINASGEFLYSRPRLGYERKPKKKDGQRHQSYRAERCHMVLLE